MGRRTSIQGQGDVREKWELTDIWDRVDDFMVGRGLCREAFSTLFPASFIINSLYYL